MPLLERQILGSASASQTDTFVTRLILRYADFAVINAPQIIKIELNPNVIRSSLQTTITNDGPNPTQLDGEFLGIPFFTPRVTIQSGIRVPFIVSVNSMRWRTISGSSAVKVWGPPPWKTPSGVTLEDINDTSSLFFSIFPPAVATPTVVLFGNFIKSLANIRWLPYNVTITVTGYVRSEFSQDTGIPEELVSASIEDLQSKELYGDRLSSSELQSDFIETQVQAIRVGEALLWNKNRVIEARFLTLFNPSVKRGSTIQVLNINNNIIFQGVVKTVGHLFDIGAGDAVTEIIATTTEYVFQSFLGTTQPDEKLDQRQ